MKLFNHGGDTGKVGKNILSDTENPFKKEKGYRNDVSLEDIGEAKLYDVDLCYKHLIGRHALVKSGRDNKMYIVRFLRATRNFEFIEVSVGGAESEWMKPYPNGLGVDFGCGHGNYTIKFVYDDDKDFVTEKLPLDGDAAAKG